MDPGPELAMAESLGLQVFICRDIPGYWGCPLCGQLWGGGYHCPGTSFRGPICDFTMDELQEVDEEDRESSGRPDADWTEVVTMLRDPGLVVFVDPADLETSDCRTLGISLY